MGVIGQRHAPAALPPRMTRYPLYRSLSRPQGRSGRVLKISPPPGFDPRTVQLVASRYADWAIPAHTFPKCNIPVCCNVWAYLESQCDAVVRFCNGEFVNGGRAVWTHVTWNTACSTALLIAEMQPARALYGARIFLNSSLSFIKTREIFYLSRFPEVKDTSSPPKTTTQPHPPLYQHK